MITKERLLKNKEIVLEKNKEYNFFNPKLLEFLGDDFFLAPATPSLDLYGAYPGGLVEHLIKVCKYSININELLPEKIRVDKKSIVRVVFLAQIGRTFLFKQNTNEWSIKQGKMYEYKDGNEIAAMSVGERSAYYALKCGVELDMEEYQAVVNSDKGSDGSIKWISKPLTHIMKLGFEMAVLEEKNG